MYRNNVELIGFTGSDAEAKTTPNGKTVTTFSIATKTSYIKDGARRENTEWHRIQAWGKLGEYAAAFTKGSHLCVEGELRSREYESNGAKVRTYDIVASSIIQSPPRPAQRRSGSRGGRRIGGLSIIFVLVCQSDRLRLRQRSRSLTRPYDRAQST